MASRTGRARKTKSDGLVQDIQVPQSDDQGVIESSKPAKTKVCFCRFAFWWTTPAKPKFHVNIVVLMI